MKNPVLLSILLAFTFFCKGQNINNQQFTQYVSNWNTAFKMGDVASFQKVYAPKVLVYHQKSTGEAIAKQKSDYLLKNKGFSQLIIGEVNTYEISSNMVYCDFTKRIIEKGKTTDYSAYLIFRKIGEKWLISAESDTLTDFNLNKNGKIKMPKNSSWGDFNGDGYVEYVWNEMPQIKEEEMDCVGECTCKLVFSDKLIPALEIPDCIGGLPQNEGDLNEDGSDEFSFISDWFTSMWTNCKVFTLKNNKWQYLVEPITLHLSILEDGVDLVQKHPTKKGYVITRGNEMEGDDMLKVIEKTVKTK